MGEILGIGATHYPPGLVPDEYKPWPLARMLQTDPRIPSHLKDPANWPEPMRLEWGDDEGITAHRAHRARVFHAFRQIREEVDAFKPDFILIWGDDQYENFKEDCVPAFAVLAYKSAEVRPWQHATRGANSWDEPEDKLFTIKGHRAAGKFVASALLHQGFDVAYAYKPLHGPGLGHAIVNSVLYLDWDRRGFPYPVVPITVNSYGRALVRAHGRPLTPSETLALEGEFDPPGPQPWRCFQLGAAVARALADGPWRVALIASSSWSHSFLVPKHALMYPDVESDRRFFDALVAGDWDTWRHVSIEEAEERGHQELLNWFCLAGAMAELDRKPDHAVFLESWITNSDKVFAAFRP